MTVPPSPLSAPDDPTPQDVSGALRVLRWLWRRQVVVAVFGVLVGYRARPDLLPAVFGAPTAAVAPATLDTLRRADSVNAAQVAKLHELFRALSLRVEAVGVVVEDRT